ncbi:response regulator [Frankia sp. CNm7]|uniref:Response regulator n=1 Tax=Frankia nepalensis TaxID=1836974 RepID=A0A937RMM1_9ACTN|nr:adenylate/guanylate cyclase domain-containing protein [Frankia nepalensis]MBL7497720.1 response regulator [Frankia nepalensis]MBL7514171.1 response regulator [Frankia nepalensis]MBL7523733.1 response regulator [Frankia nepalensis]MBL7629183.1 response regulator [Frankia nepalensis]
MEQIGVLLADDNLIVRAGVRALLDRVPGVTVVGVAADRDELVQLAHDHRPQVVVTDIRMPPTFTDEGIDAAREIREHAPGTGVVLLSQYDEPEYAVGLLAGADAGGCAYLLKERLADPELLVRAIREVAAGASMLDPQIVAAVLSPVRDAADLTDDQERLLREVAEGRSIRAIAESRGDTPAAVNAAIDTTLLRLAQGASNGRAGALRQLRMLHAALVRRDQEGEALSRLLPGGLAEKLRADAGAGQRTERLVVTVLMSDIRGYTTIAERTDPIVLAGLLDAHRREMNAAILSEGGTVLQYAGDAVIAVFGAPNPCDDHQTSATRAAATMHARQRALNFRWELEGLAPFGLGIGVSTGEVAAALLGSEARREYTLVGDTMNLAARLQAFAQPGQTVLSEPTALALPPAAAAALIPLPPLTVKGRAGAVSAYLADERVTTADVAARFGPAPVRVPAPAVPSVAGPAGRLAPAEPVRLPIPEPTPAGAAAHVVVGARPAVSRPAASSHPFSPRPRPRVTASLPTRCT